MPYALRSTVNSADLEIAEILLSLNKSSVTTHSVIDVNDSESEYVPDDDSVAESEYVPEEEDSGSVVVVDDDANDEDYVPEDDEDDDEEFVPVDDPTDEEYVPDENDMLEDVIRQACSSIARGSELPREFWKVLTLAHKNQVPASFKRWMLGIPPVKSIYTSFAMRS